MAMKRVQISKSKFRLSSPPEATAAWSVGRSHLVNCYKRKTHLQVIHCSLEVNGRIISCRHSENLCNPLQFSPDKPGFSSKFSVVFEVKYCIFFIIHFRFLTKNKLLNVKAFNFAELKLWTRDQVFFFFSFLFFLFIIF